MSRYWFTYSGWKTEKGCIFFLPYLLRVFKVKLFFFVLISPVQFLLKCGFFFLLFHYFYIALCAFKGRTHHRVTRLRQQRKRGLSEPLQPRPLHLRWTPPLYPAPPPRHFTERANQLPDQRKTTRRHVRTPPKRSRLTAATRSKTDIENLNQIWSFQNFSGVKLNPVQVTKWKFLLGIKTQSLENVMLFS